MESPSDFRNVALFRGTSVGYWDDIFRDCEMTRGLSELEIFYVKYGDTITVESQEFIKCRAFLLSRCLINNVELTPIIFLFVRITSVVSFDGGFI